MSDERKPDENETPEPRKTAAGWAKLKGTSPHVVAGVRVHARWVLGAELTEAEYDAAIGAFLQEPIR